jgi:hypothetical protein
MKHIHFLAFTCALILASCTSDYENGSLHFENGDYEQAILALNNVGPDDENYLGAQDMIVKAGYAILENERKQEVEDSVNTYQEQLNSANQTIERLNKELLSIKDFDGSSYADIDGIKVELALFQTWITLCNESENHASKEVQKLGNQLRKELQKLQAKEYPKMRGRMCSYLDTKLWEDNIDVAVSGSGKTILTFTGGIFANNANIKEYQTTLNETFTLLRFKRIQYKWYEYDDTYTYYTLEVSKDTDLILL